MLTRASSLDHRTRGQALVETAILFPILLILLVAAIDFGRAFFGWVNLHQAARVGANYAATHPGDNFADPTLTYYTLMEREALGINCDLVRVGGLLPGPEFSSGGAPTNDPELGDLAKVELECGFELITPIAAQIVGNTITMAAESSFPVRQGCIDCPAPATPPPPPQPQDPCRDIPVLTTLSVDGARLKWASAGFSPAAFLAPAGALGTDTVSSAPEPVVTDGAPGSCLSPQVAVTSSVQVWTDDPDPVTAGCLTVPNLTGITIEDARATWTSLGFLGEFLPPLPDADPDVVVVGQLTVDSSDPGVSCMPATTTIEVQTGPPWPPAPPAPCRVPSFAGARLNTAQDLWNSADFTTTVQSVGGSGNWVIQAQSLLATTWFDCGVPITVYQNELAP